MIQTQLDTSSSTRDADHVLGAKDHALRAKKYLVQTRATEASRINLIDGGYREELMVILQPAPHEAPEITASPTLKPSDVHIIQNCKPKKTKPRKRGS
jgi:hypothetical protein